MLKQKIEIIVSLIIFQIKGLNEFLLKSERDSSIPGYFDFDYHRSNIIIAMDLLNDVSRDLENSIRKGGDKK